MATFVLIPGAGGDAWQWHLLVLELEARGHEAIAVTLPSGDESAGWHEYADAVVEAIGRRRDDLVLVAQSLAGFTAPLVVDRLPVRLIVLLNAMVPLPGETGNAWWADTGQPAAAEAYAASIGLPPDAAGDDRVVYFHDVPEPIVDEAYRRGEPQQTMTPMSQSFALSAWPDVPTRVVAGRDDRLFPATFQQRIARKRLDLEADVIPGGHMVALSHPAELADLLVSYLEPQVG
ncbi:MAG TPA: alpha/beta hydrolase [Candidatus Limnocylindrales bacterium]|jgi:pimeloyl-ACP methyl ester carboxylesterase